MKRLPLTALFKSDASAEMATPPATSPSWRTRMRALAPAIDTVRDHSGFVIAPKWQLLLKRYRLFLLIVILPTLVATAYLYLIAANQYASEAHFFITGLSSSQPQQSSVISQLLGGGGGQGASEQETLNVVDFLQSQAAIDSLKKKIDIVGIFRRPEADFVARLWYSRPSAEDLYFYYWWMVEPYIDYTNNVAVIRAKGFRPEDAQLVTETLLQLADQLVDKFNRRAEEEVLRVSRDEVARAEHQVAAVRDKVTNFRVHQQALDPGKSSTTVLDVIASLEGTLAQAQSEMTNARRYLKPDSARFQELANRVKSIQAQIDSQKARLTGPDGAMAPVLVEYQKLMLEQQFADQDYNAALTSLESARLDAEKQHLFLVRVVEPNHPEDSTYPKSFLTVVSLLLGLTVAYCIGWLIFTGFREHAS